MFNPKKILFPVDFSERSVDAARMVEIYAGHFQARLTLLHVVEPLTYNDLPVDTTGIEKEQLAGFLVDELRHFDVTRVLAYGEPGLRIVEQAEREGADLIMMPTHGYGRFRRFILGSVTAKVLHDAKCPVWTGAHSERIPAIEKIEIRRVLCAIDLGRRSCEALKTARGVAREFGADLTVVHAVPSARDVPGMPDDPDWRQTLLQSAHGQIAGVLQDLAIDAEVRVEADEAPRAVHDCAAAIGADLLVIGRSMEEGVLGRLRTNAYSIIRQSPCPVLSV